METIVDKIVCSSEISNEIQNMGLFFSEYLEQSYKIKQRGSKFYLSCKSKKIIMDEVTLKKMVKYKIHDINTQKMFITRFLMKSLHNNWSIEKKHNNYILTKKHHNKKAYLSSKFLPGFIETNFL